MNATEDRLSRTVLERAQEFGSLIRRRRQALKMSQDQLALVTGVGRRFLIDLEAGKPSCQLGRSLVVAEALGLRLTDLLSSNSGSLTSEGASNSAADLPDLPEGKEASDG
jgi:transcriptional regulator with XRE-family HTH domain